MVVLTQSTILVNMGVQASTTSGSESASIQIEAIPSAEADEVQFKIHFLSDIRNKKQGWKSVIAHTLSHGSASLDRYRQDNTINDLPASR